MILRLLPRAALTFKLQHSDNPIQKHQMVATDRVSAIFADARAVHADALRLLAQGDIRDAAEKAWCATKRATDALILARTGEEPEITSETSIGLLMLVEEDNAVRPLIGRYYSRQGQLHGNCFYMGLCQPITQTERRIRETADYIQDTENLANFLATDIRGE